MLVQIGGLVDRMMNYKIKIPLTISRRNNKFIQNGRDQFSFFYTLIFVLFPDDERFVYDIKFRNYLNQIKSIDNFSNVKTIFKGQ